ncbi:MAG: hypothetical protein RI973_983 [Bacteroidota bacterium]|jgi:hypothetical protein
MNELLRFLTTASENGGSARDKISVPCYWRGGTGGAPHDWNDPRNWCNGRVPGWFDTAVISPKYTLEGCFPIIGEFANDISQLYIEEDAHLCISPKGRLCIDSMKKHIFGLVNDGELSIEGELTLLRTSAACIRNNGYIINTGSLAADRKEVRLFSQGDVGIFENYGEILYF